MNVEDEYFLALENRDTQLMIANKKLEEKEEQLSQQQERTQPTERNDSQTNPFATCLRQYHRANSSVGSDGGGGSEDDTGKVVG